MLEHNIGGIVATDIVVGMLKHNLLSGSIINRHSS